MAWIGVVPFRMEGVMRRPFPNLPWISAFPELNVRTYVEHEGKPGVWFCSLDATNPLAVWAARRYFHLPYHRAEMRIVRPATVQESEFRYKHYRIGSPVSFEATYAPTGHLRESDPGTLEHFLTERYCLYAQSPMGEIFRTDVHHAPWYLSPAEATIEWNTMGLPFRLDLSDPPALLHYARRVDVVVWSPELVHS